MTRVEKLIDIARGLGACESGLKDARSLPSREVIRRHACWIMRNLRHWLHRRELWRVVKIDPLISVCRGWDVLTQDMRDWIEEQHPEAILRNLLVVDLETAERCVLKRPSFALEHSAHLLPNYLLTLAARLRPDTALDRAARYLDPEVFWECAQKSDRLRRPLWSADEVQRPKVTCGPILTRTYYVIHVRGGWHMIRSENDPVFVPAATAREARQLAVNDAERQVLFAKNRIIQFAAGDRPRYKEIVL